eukprot:13987075-Alexandrium_andersonii.AAC.2
MPRGHVACPKLLEHETPEVRSCLNLTCRNHIQFWIQVSAPRKLPWEACWAARRDLIVPRGPVLVRPSFGI